MQEWLNWTPSKSVVPQGTVGSNPTLSAKPDETPLRGFSSHGARAKPDAPAALPDARKFQAVIDDPMPSSPYSIPMDEACILAYMAIAPTCDKCKQELVEFGAILLSPPNQDNEVRKFHICKACYAQYESDLG